MQVQPRTRGIEPRVEKVRQYYVYVSLRAARIMISAAVAMSAAVAPASADYGRLLDPADDTHGALDITDLIFSHRNWGGKKRFAHLVAMDHAWKPKLLDRQHRVIHLFFDTRQKVGYEQYSFVTERRVEIFFKDGRLRGVLFNNLGDPPKRISNVRVRPSGNKGVYVVVPKQLLSRRPLRYYEWAFMTVFARRGHPHCPLSDPCYDRIGDYIRHDLR